MSRRVLFVLAWSIWIAMKFLGITHFDKGELFVGLWYSGALLGIHWWLNRPAVPAPVEESTPDQRVTESKTKEKV